ncbi:glycosyltransferase family 4 protein [Rhodoplanes azumiensis]|uniref:Glycosyltransferase family 4 protein n=1 Tax=Rhodoplanes azumiensis TaxID=1897628 RepID=A0ABW5ANY3_9BRAD
MSPLPSSPPPLFVDLTTAFQERGRIAHGTVRVERELVGALAERAIAGRDDLRFCRFDPAAHRFVAVTAEEALAVARAATEPERRRTLRPAWRSHPLLQLGRRLERFVRTEIRDRFRRRRRAVVAAVAPIAGAAEIFPAGAWLLLPGELQRQDFAYLIALRRRLGLRLATVFYDLLGTLPPGDPRIDDPDAADIPSSEFILRHAALVLSISQFSADTLAAHAAQRGMAMPPLSVIRLGHRLGPPEPDLPPVDGLPSGGYVLTVGDVTGRKNHRLLTDIWGTLARARAGRVPPLVIAGRIGRDGAPLVAAVTADRDAAPVVRFLSNVDDRQLRWLYANCRFTVFPSISEGFGLPVVESQALGKACLASTATAIPEASQGAALHLDPTDVAAWRRAIETLLDDDAALARAEATIAEKFRLVGWDDTAADVLAATDAARAADPSQAVVRPAP